MFKKILGENGPKGANGDIVTKVNILENKVDILLSNMSDLLSKENRHDKCHCKNAELIVYNEIKTYINDKFTDLEYDLCEKFENVEKNTDDIKKLFNNYKNDVINNMEFLIDHIYKETQNFKEHIVFTKIKNMIDFAQNDYFDKINNELAIINNKLNEINDISTNLNDRYTIDSHLFKYENFYNILCQHILSIIKDIDKLINEL